LDAVHGGGIHPTAPPSAEVVFFMAITKEEAHWLYPALKGIEFLTFCSLGEIEELTQSLIKKHFKKGETIVREGDKGDYLFLLYAGEVSVRAKSGVFGTKELAKLGPGNYFGEMALILHEPRAATVVASQDTDAFLLFSTDFRKVLEKNDELARSIEEHAAKRRADRELELRKAAYDKSRTLLGRLFGK
jgi:CRP/FNR family transcriptional regulator, cyclic AMP receptor protein